MKSKQLYKKISHFIKNELPFLKNVSIMLGGRLYVALLSLAFTPILARLFTPAALEEDSELK